MVKAPKHRSIHKKSTIKNKQKLSSVKKSSSISVLKPSPVSVVKSSPSRPTQIDSNTPSKPNWYAALVFENAYSKPVSSSDIVLIEKASEHVSQSGLPEKKKKMLLDYLSVASDGGRFGILQSEAITNKYLLNKIDDSRLEFEIALMAGWINNVDSFIENQTKLILPKISKEEKNVLVEIIDYSSKKSPFIRVVVASSLYIYHPMANTEKRQNVLFQLRKLLGSE